MLLFVTTVSFVSNPKYILGSVIFTASSVFSKLFWICSKFPLLLVVEADVIIAPYPWVYSYVLLLYVPLLLTISLGETYTNLSFPFIVYLPILVSL